MVGVRNQKSWRKKKREKCQTRREWLEVAPSLYVIDLFDQRGPDWGNSKLGWLVGISIQAMWADSLYFLCLLLTSMCKILASFQDI
jgi:hypothetical protein